MMQLQGSGPDRTFYSFEPDSLSEMSQQILYSV